MLLMVQIVHVMDGGYVLEIEEVKALVSWVLEVVEMLVV